MKGLKRFTPAHSYEKTMTQEVEHIPVFVDVGVSLRLSQINVRQSVSCFRFEWIWVPSVKQDCIWLGLLLWKVRMKGVDLVCAAFVKVKFCHLGSENEASCCNPLKFHTTWLVEDFIHGAKAPKDRPWSGEKKDIEWCSSSVCEKILWR